MDNVRKICIVTGSRAEYGLLYWLIKEVETTNNLELQIIVTGMHLSQEFGLTYKCIEEDGFRINKKVETLLSSDSEVGLCKSMGLGMIGFADAFADLKPDLLLVLGDRFEIFSAVSAATLFRIPVAHLHGGETTEGAFDESFRHSISKMSHLHFTATEEYRDRVIQLGEHPDRVFNVGAIGIDNIKRLTLLSKDKLEKSLGLKFNKYNLLINFHSVTLEDSTAESQITNLLLALDELDETHLFFTKTNADTNGRIINKIIDEYVNAHSEKAIVHTTLGQLRYLSVLRFVDAVVGNSSSGLFEAPSFNIGTINIGDRQRGRIKAASVIDCEPTVVSIRNALKMLFEELFTKKLSTVTNLYGAGGVAQKITKIISEYDLNNILKKKFFNIKWLEELE